MILDIDAIVDGAVKRAVAVAEDRFRVMLREELQRRDEASVLVGYAALGKFLGGKSSEAARKLVHRNQHLRALCLSVGGRPAWRRCDLETWVCRSPAVSK